MITNYSKFVSILFSLLMFNTAFMACSEDDDDNGGGGGGGATGGAVTTYGTIPGAGTGSLAPGLRYKSINGNQFVYNADGSLAKITEDDDYYARFSYNPYKIELVWDGEVETTLKDFKTDKNGYVTSFKETYTFIEDGVTESFNSTYSLSYNDGRLSKMTAKATIKVSYEGQSMTATADGTWKYTWQNGNLTKLVGEATSKIAGETIKTGSTYTLEYGDLDNNLMQHVEDAIDPYVVNDADFMPMLNMMGKPSAKFPIKMVYEDYEMLNGTIEYSDTDTEYIKDYTFNADGTLATYLSGGTSDGGGYYYKSIYTYETPDDETKSAEVVVTDDTAAKKLLRKNHRWFKLPEVRK